MSNRMPNSQRSSENVQLNIKELNIKGGIKDIEELRKLYELPHHWALRKEFIQIYHDKFDYDRLICLSNVFVNVECMGLTYPPEVMKLIKELGSKVRGLETYRHQLERNEPELPRRESNQQWGNRRHQQYQQQQQRY